jgi:hypothetical protein
MGAGQPPGPHEVQTAEDCTSCKRSLAEPVAEVQFPSFRSAGWT